MQPPVAYLVTLGVLVASRPAIALNQNQHAEYSGSACSAAGFSEDFCLRVADEAFDTDAFEFEVLAAHGQPADGEPRCVAANNTVTRLRILGREMRDGLMATRNAPSDLEAGARIATSLGRALHTIQDNCAHSGMPNPQHAWFSLADTCTGSRTSPDVQKDACNCAHRETEFAMQAFAKTVKDLGIPLLSLQARRNTRHFPKRSAACEFLHQASEWDGLDRRWDNAVVVPILRSEFAIGVGSDRFVAPTEMCDIQKLSIPLPSNVDVSHGAASCPVVELFCRGDDGKEDSEAEPPWSVEDAEDANREMATGGCQAGAGSTSALLIVFAGALYWIATRKR